MSGAEARACDVRGRAANKQDRLRLLLYSCTPYKFEVVQSRNNTLYRIFTWWHDH